MEFSCFLTVRGPDDGSLSPSKQGGVRGLHFLFVQVKSDSYSVHRHLVAYYLRIGEKLTHHK